MCKIADYPELYYKIDWVLRLMKMSKETPGYELLRRAVVIWKVEGDKMESEVSRKLPETEREQLLEARLVERVKETASMDISKNRVIKNDRDAFSQAMIEEIRAVSEYGDKKTILEFVRDITKHIF